MTRLITTCNKSVMTSSLALPHARLHERHHLTPPRKTPPGSAGYGEPASTATITQGQLQHSAEFQPAAPSADSGRLGTLPAALACKRRSSGYFPPGGVMAGARR
jgi:hypothetical protein